ncbi:hypothetical protein APHAL10511_006926 [Amanita phalloides]|nr:hypothetical protein APHAL10511_006926 [Amanita phalloides]
MTPQYQQHQYVAIIIMGVSGTGKSTLGSALAHELGFPYIEGDELHPKSNIDKMSSGIPLTDADREPWLALIRKTAKESIIDERCKHGQSKSLVGVVIACSALKKHYRDILRGRVEPHSVLNSSDSSYESSTSSLPDLRTYFVFISGPRELLYKRLEARPGHFMKAYMLDSQIAALESPAGEEDVIIVAMEDGTEAQLEQVIEGLKQAGASL